MIKQKIYDFHQVPPLIGQESEDWLSKMFTPKPSISIPPPIDQKEYKIPDLQALQRDGEVKEPKTILERLKAANDFVQSSVAKGRPFKKIWLKRTIATAMPLLGQSSPFIQRLITARQQVSHNTLSQDEFDSLFHEVSYFVSYLEIVASSCTSAARSHANPPFPNKCVFLIHGHDEVNTLRLEKMFRDHFDLPQVIMRAKPGKGRPLLTKFEEEAEVATFAVALLTPDDTVSSSETPYEQARPNVIYEIGWFIGRLGRSRVLLVVKTGTHIHSDLYGVSRIEFQENVEETVIEIKRELKAAGLVS